MSSTSLTAQIPAADLASSGTDTVTVKNPAPSGGTSASQTVAVNPKASTLNLLSVEGSDVAWDASRKKLYVVVPASAASHAGTITTVDPVTGTIESSLTPTTAPSGLAISDDGQFLYAVVNGSTTIQRYLLPSLTADISWSLGTDPTFGYTNLAGDVKVQPGAAHTVAVSFGQYGSGAIAVFDDGVKRSSTVSGPITDIGNSLQWKPDGTALYASFGVASDCPYYSSVSDDSLLSIPVNASGLGAITTYHSAFRGEGSRIHLDPATSFVYGDWGEVVNAANGSPLGNYRFTRPYGTYSPGPLSALDPTLHRFYSLIQLNGPNFSTVFQIQTFDQTTFKLLSTMILPNAVGTPTNLIRWGQSGLAWVTTGGSMYILDGSFVNPSGATDTSAGSSVYPTPTLVDIAPTTTLAGSGATTITVTGHDFAPQTSLYWNGVALQTTMVSDSELSAQVPASDLTSVGQGAITATSTGNSTPASNSVAFSVNPAPPNGTTVSVYNTGGNDLIWDKIAGKLYVSMPGIQGDAGDAIAVVDPLSGSITSSGFLGSDPANLSLSSDGQYLYSALYGQNSIQQLSLPSLTVNTSWNLGGATNFGGAYYALDLQAAPGAAQTTAVVLANFDVSPSPVSLVVYDGSTPRSSALNAIRYPYSSLQWAGSDTSLYAVDQQVPQDFLTLGVGPSGATFTQAYTGIVNPYSTKIHYDAGNGLVYTDGGQAIRPSDGAVLGSFNASGIAAPDASLNRVFILGQTSAQVGTSSFTIQSFNQTTFALVSSMTIDNVIGAPTAFVRWGNSGLAFTTRVGLPSDFYGAGPGQLYVVDGSFAKSSTTGMSFNSLQRVRRTWRSNPRQRTSATGVHRNLALE